MLRVGLTGGYATGKSFVARELTRLGCHLIYADLLGHRVLEPGGEAFEPAIAAFGKDILDPKGQIDRKRLGSIVFDSPERLQTLTDLVHPAVFRAEQQLMNSFEAEDPNGIVVVEAAILIETGRYKTFDRMIVTICDEETQIKRALARDGSTREQIKARLARQLPSEQKRSFADFVINTEGSKEDTTRQVETVFRSLSERAVRTAS